MSVSASATELEPSTQVRAPLTFITCGSVDDGKSTLIGRLLLDSRSLLQDQISSARRGHGASSAMDLASLTDGLSAEREQGITIDVAWRYFATPQRKFIIGDSPGHQQYTRNMVTAASQAQAAVVLVDATKLQWRQPLVPLLEQTRRHSLLLQLLRVPQVIFAVNKLDAVEDAALAFAHIAQALRLFAQSAQLSDVTILPISALHGQNVVDSVPGWAGYDGPSLLECLENCPDQDDPDLDAPTHFSVQWVQKLHDSADTSRGRRVLWGRVLQGQIGVGDTVQINAGQTARVAAIRRVAPTQTAHAQPGSSVGVVLDAEYDVSRGDVLQSPHAPPSVTQAWATVAWLDKQPLALGRSYWALHGHRWVKAKVTTIAHQLNIHTLEPQAAHALGANAIGRVELRFQSPLPLCPFDQSKTLGRMILVDATSHATAAAVLISSAN